MKSWLSYVNLSDTYERKARFLPALLAALPLLPVSAAFGGPVLEWLKLVCLGVGLAAVVAVAISHVASAAGNRLQQKLWPSWPHDAPTNRWLHPDDKTVSNQQKERWYQAIKDLLQLDIQAAVTAGDADELKAVIKDAVQSLRNRLWKTPQGERAQMHNIEYGFARNLTGLRPVWLTFAVASAAGSWVGYVWLKRPVLWAVVASVVLLGTAGLAATLPTYVRQKAHYYAESFFEAVMKLRDDAQTGKTPETSTPADAAGKGREELPAPTDPKKAGDS